jgi:putative DNA primase/helicase
VHAGVDNEKEGPPAPQAIQPDEDLVAEMKAEVEQERRQLAGDAATEYAGAAQVDDPGGEQTESLEAARAASSLPTIDVANRPMHEISEDALAALVAANTPLQLFRQAKSLVRIERDDSGNATTEFLDIDRLRGEVDRAAFFVVQNGPRIRYTVIADKVLKDMLSHKGHLNRFPPLEGITCVPLLRPDGTVLDTPGYDAATNLFYAPAPGLVVPAIPDRPDADQIAAAAKKLLEPLKEFPYIDDSSRCNAVGMLLTAILRPAIPGPVPMALVTSPTPCTGKSLMVNTVTRIATGRASESIMLSESEAENQKRVTTFFSEGGTILCLDNERGVLRSVSVTRAITEPRWKCRLLGLNRTIDVPIKITPMVTGNNLGASSEITRRCYPVRIDAGVPRPQERELELSIPDLDAWAVKHRGEVIAAALTLARAHAIAGSPAAPGIPRTGNFDAWAKLVGGILHVGGFDSFLHGMAEFYGRNDHEGQEWQIFLQAMWRKFGARTFTAVEAAEIDACDLPETLAEKYNSAAFPVKLGKALGSIEGRPFGAEQLSVHRAGFVHGRATWRVKSATGQNCSTDRSVELRPAPKPAPVRVSPGAAGDAVEVTQIQN